jgi:Tfp pilus assembly protein FimT
MNVHTFTEVPILAALIAATSALVIAVFQFFTQRRQSTSIEELKARLSQQGAAHAKYLETYLNLILEGRQQQTQAYASLLQAVQLMRDKMRSFLGQPESYQSDVICREVSNQAQEIVTIYSANQLQFGEDGRHLSHDVKNLAYDAATQFERLRLGHPGNAEHVEQLSSIRKIEERFAELQVRLRRQAVAANNAFVRSLEAGNGKSLT